MVRRARSLLWIIVLLGRVDDGWYSLHSNIVNSRHYIAGTIYIDQDQAYSHIAMMSITQFQLDGSLSYEN